MQLSVYLLDKSHTSSNGIAKRLESAGYEAIDVPESSPAYVKAFKKRTVPKAPDWVKWVSSLIPLAEADFESASSAFIMILSLDDRIFVVPFGFGHTGIDRKIIQQDFGLQVAMRVVDPNEVSLIDVRNIGRKTRQKRSVLANKGTLQQLDVAVERELTFRLVGSSDGVISDKRVAGGSSFIFDLEDISGLAEKCRELLATLEKPIKKDFEVMNQFETENDPEILMQLDEWLIERLHNRQLDSLSVALPDLDISCPADFCIYRGSQKAISRDLDIDFVCEGLHGICGDHTAIDDIKLAGRDGSGERVTKSYSVRECLVAEKPGEGKDADIIHILSLGSWHRVAKSYIRNVNLEVDRMPKLDIAGLLPECEEGWSEGDYNIKAVEAAKAERVLLDKKEFQEGLGRSSIEVCDIYTTDKHLFCVKHYSCSATLSHLYAQGSVSSGFLKNHRDYQDYLLSKVGSIGAFDPEKFDEKDFTFVYAIIMDSQRSVPSSLPFFSKVNLLHHSHIIQGLGFKVCLYHIPLVPSNKPEAP